MRWYHVSIAAVLLVLCTAAAATAAAPQADGFRCLRPFAAMDSFVAVAKADTSHNCAFHYFTVTSASAELSCATAAGSDTSAASASPTNARGEAARSVDSFNADTTSCSVTVQWSMRRAGNVARLLQRQVGTDADYLTHNATSQRTRRPPAKQKPPVLPFLTEEEDVWRFNVALRAKGDSTVQYKGFNSGDGYSMCCDCIDEADCVWLSAEQGDNDLVADEVVDPDVSLPHRRILRGCPLPFPFVANLIDETEGDGDDAGAAAGTAFGSARVTLTDLDDEEAEGGGGVFHGRITKPLHRLVEGPWEATVQLWRRRVQLPVELSSATDADADAASDNSNIEAEVLGRIVVPFTLDLAELAKEGRVRQVASMALMVEDVTEVKTAPLRTVATEVSADDDRGDL
jgi:hypothetical protein